MSSVTGRISEIKQPRGGYINPSQFEVQNLDDGLTLSENENVHASAAGMMIDYPTGFTIGIKVTDAFNISLKLPT